MTKEFAGFFGVVGGKGLDLWGFWVKGNGNISVAPSFGLRSGLRPDGDRFAMLFLAWLKPGPSGLGFASDFGHAFLGRGSRVARVGW